MVLAGLEAVVCQVVASIAAVAVEIAIAASARQVLGPDDDSSSSSSSSKRRRWEKVRIGSQVRKVVVHMIIVSLPGRWEKEETRGATE
jgi:hypothetical protein